MGYRQCEYESNDYLKLIQKKQIVSEMIDSRVKNSNMKGFHYKKISKKSANYYKKFEQIYEYKCAYCGINTSINPTAMFEIDHFINEKQKKSPTGNTVDHIENLIFSCRKCNQAKDDFHVNGAYNLLHPDKGLLPNIFERDSHYMIVINDKYSDNETIQHFYEKLDFSNRFRKLDYLLLNLNHMKNSNKDSEINALILQVYVQLIEMRNNQI